MSLRRKIILIALAAAVLVPTGFMYYIATTESGLQFLARRVSGQIGPVTITIEGVRGTLVRGFAVGSLRVQHRRADVLITGADGHVELLPLLLRQRVHMRDAHAATVTVTVFPSDNVKREWEPHFLPATLRIDVDDARGDLVRVIAPNGTVLEFTGGHAVATVFPKQIRVRTSEADFLSTHIVASGRVLAAKPFGLRGEGQLHYRPQGLPEWQIHTRIEGDLDRLPIQAQIQVPFHAQVNGVAEDLTSGWHYAGHAVVRDFDLVPFGGGSALGILSGELDVTANPRGYTARGTVTAPGLKAGPMAVTFDGAYADKHLQIRQATATHAASGAHGSVHGDVEIVEGGPRLALAGEWTRFRWPLAATEPAFTSASGHFKLSGQKPWHVESDGLLSVLQWKDLPGTLRGTLAGDVLQIDSAQIGVMGGSANLSGEARWQPGESWYLMGRATNFDPAQLRADLPGQLSFDFDARGTRSGTGASLDFDVKRLSGRLRGQNASGGGHLALAAGSTDWQFRDVDVHLGRTHLALNGSLGPRRDLQFSIDAEDLSLLDPDAKGRISAKGRLAGTDAAPLLLFTGRGADFEWRDQKLAALNADVDIDLATARRTQGQIDLKGLTIGSRTAQHVNVQLQGTMDAQRIVASMEAAPLHGALVADGVIADGQWRGNLSSLSVDDTHNLQLKLEAPAPLQFTARQFRVENLCLMGDGERICGAGDLDRVGAWRAQVAATSLPLRALTAGLTQNINYDGTINVSADAAGARGAPVTGSVKAQLQGAQLRHLLGSGREERMSLGSGSVTGRATADAFELQVGLDAGDAGHISGQLNGQRNGDDWRDYPVRGSLAATTTSLGILDIYLGGIDKAIGRLTTDVSIAGTLGQPQIEGTLQLRDSQIDVYQVNLSLRALSLDARFDANALDLSGQTKIGNGSASFNGRLAWKDREPYGNLHVEGENLRVVNVPEARIDASPKLDFKLTGRRIDASGEVKLPQARIEPADLTNAVLASSDEVLVGAPPVDPSQRWTVVSDIRLTLGDDVSINTQGLSAKLGGSIVLRTDESQISRGQGELNVTSGKYKALGRLLDIERGRLLFNNGPLGDPGIDLRAQKVFPDVTAGVNVRGTLRAPRMTFFSEPAIPQSQIASLILSGGSLAAVQDNTTRPGAARNDLLMQGGAIIAQQIGGRVGIQDVSIEPTFDANSSNATGDNSLVLGRYLSPRFYVSYGISLAEAINTLKLRYTIGDHWTLKTEAGKARSADIVFTVRNPRLGKKKAKADAAPKVPAPASSVAP